MWTQTTSINARLFRLNHLQVSYMREPEICAIALIKEDEDARHLDAAIFGDERKTNRDGSDA